MSKPLPAFSQTVTFPTKLRCYLEDLKVARNRMVYVAGQITENDVIESVDRAALHVSRAIEELNLALNLADWKASVEFVEQIKKKEAANVAAVVIE